ncbi:MAG: sigma-70 family RNA polymerase sigma factor [Chloroflexota bacterium]|nr:sigma-70 family RNA polymerase sigma factor [Chloroflexota bacterium]
MTTAKMTDLTNEQWIAALSENGQPAQSDALADLRRRLQRSIYFYLSQDRSDLRGLAAQELAQMAEDLAQDATLRVIDNLGKFRGESRFTTWATKIAIRLAISDLRRSRYKDFSLDELTADGDLLPMPTRLASAASPTPEKVAERDDVLEKIELALKEALTERQYQALVAVAIKGIPMDILAERMGSNRNALYKLIHDARRKLKTHLEAQGISTDYMMNLFGN